MKRDLIRTTLKVRVRIIRPDWEHFFLAALPLVNNTCFCCFLSFLFCFLFIPIIYWLYLVLGPVDTYPFSFENATFSLRIRLPSTLIRWKRSMKTLFPCVRVDRRKRNFSKTLRSHYQFHSTPRNIRNLFKMADRRFPFLSFNTYASSMRSFRSQIDSSYTCGRENTMRKRCEWTRIFLKTEKKSFVFKWIRIRKPLAFKNASFLTCNTVSFIFESTPIRFASFYACVYIAVQLDYNGLHTRVSNRPYFTMTTFDYSYSNLFCFFLSYSSLSTPLRLKKQ